MKAGYLAAVLPKAQDKSHTTAAELLRYGTDMIYRIYYFCCMVSENRYSNTAVVTEVGTDSTMPQQCQKTTTATTPTNLKSPLQYHHFHHNHHDWLLLIRQAGRTRGFRNSVTLSLYYDLVRRGKERDTPPWRKSDEAFGIHTSSPTSASPVSCYLLPRSCSLLL